MISAFLDLLPWRDAAPLPTWFDPPRPDDKSRYCRECDVKWFGAAACWCCGAPC